MVTELLAVSPTDARLYCLMRPRIFLTLIACCAALSGASAPIQPVAISFPASKSSQPLDGRLFLLLSTDPSAEPRNQIDDTPRSQIVFGVTVDAMAPGQAIAIEDSAAGYPISSL